MEGMWENQKWLGGFHIPAHLNQFFYGSFGLDNEVTFLLPMIIADLLTVGKIPEQLQEHGILEQNSIIILTWQQNRLTQPFIYTIVFGKSAGFLLEVHYATGLKDHFRISAFVDKGIEGAAKKR